MNNNNLAGQNGFTLLELIVIIGILGLMTSLATEYMVNQTNQQRYQTTQTRVQQIHYAIVGDSSRTLNQQPVFSGYIADTGQIPKYLRDLLSNGYCTIANMNHQTECANAGGEWREAKNWKGPYLQATGFKKLCAPTDANAQTTALQIPTFRDGWGSHSSYDCQDYQGMDHLNFGWGYQAENQQIQLTAYGLNGPDTEHRLATDSSEYLYEKDMTHVINAAQYQGAPIRVELDYLTPHNPTGANQVEVQQVEAQNVSAHPKDAQYCLKVDYPDGTQKNIDLAHTHIIPAGNLYGRVKINPLIKNNPRDNCDAARLIPQKNPQEYYAHNLFSTGTALKIKITL